MPKDSATYLIFYFFSGEFCTSFSCVLFIFTSTFNFLMPKDSATYLILFFLI
jgi:hypothetical protein